MVGGFVMPTFRQLTALASDMMAGKPAKLRSPKWPAARKAWLKDHPTCACCGVKKLVEVHHVKSFHEHPELELDSTNFISLCDGPNSCHRTWGHFWDWKKINPTVREDIAVWLKRIRAIFVLLPE
jgi:hypothetical protein